MRQPMPLGETPSLLFRTPEVPKACDIYLCCVPIRNYCVGLFSSISSSSRSVCGDSWDKHWLVVFDYGEDKVVVCEGNKDSARILAGSKSWKRWADLEAYSKIHLGRHAVPEKRIDKAIRDIENGRYHVTNNNCQTWVQKLLRRLEINVTLDEPDARTVVREVVEPTVLTSAMIISPVVIISALLTLLSLGRI